MLTELVLTTSLSDSTIQVWDFKTGTLLTSFKQNICYQHGLALIPFPGQPNRVGLIIAAQCDKALLHVYSWQKDQPYRKIICPEKLVSVAISNQGAYCACGTDNGKIYIWELSTGILCRVYDAHYKKISVLKFTNDDTALISGSEDAGVNVWLTCSILNVSTDESPAPFHSWSEHSLPITDLICGIGSFRTARVLTSSLDHTCKLWDLSSGHLLTTFVFPTAINAIALDPAERMFFAGGRDNLIYQVNLYRKLENRIYNASGQPGFEITAVGGAGVVEDVASEHDDKRGLIFRGHGMPITTLSLSYDATLLLSGSQDETVKVWDIASRQMIKNFTHLKGPIVNIQTFIKPPDLFNLGLSPAKIMEQPIQHFKRTQGISIKEDSEIEESVIMVLSDNTKEIDIYNYNCNSQVVASYESLDLQKTKSTQVKFRNGDATTILQTQISELQSELIRIHGHYQHVKGLHDEMYQELVTDFISKRRAEGN
ncbi:WD40-repeat-containing domain protein [Gigaspora rosea]|uniref:WD40-repeat-containing domain protein n=1 Tax=Gigaspora rosea TaxID=44941 RepID=A0A397V7M7_9GLOM|nr:WD40-repeat-containing domain protein [Gigaspora rosea]